MHSPRVHLTSSSSAALPSSTPRVKSSPSPKTSKTPLTPNSTNSPKPLSELYYLLIERLMDVMRMKM